MFGGFVFFGPLIMFGGFAFWTAIMFDGYALWTEAKLVFALLLSIFLEAYTCCLEAFYSCAGLFLLFDSSGKDGNQQLQKAFAHAAGVETGTRL